jgi:hypothetical protein
MTLHAELTKQALERTATRRGSTFSMIKTSSFGMKLCLDMLLSFVE